MLPICLRCLVWLVFITGNDIDLSNWDVSNLDADWYPLSGSFDGELE